MKKFIILLMVFGTVCYLISTTANAQRLAWKGTVDNDFFNELNWQLSTTLQPPAVNTINPGVSMGAINIEIYNVTKPIVANGTINLGSASLSMGDSTLSGTAISNGNIIFLDEGGYIELSSTAPISATSICELRSGIAWIRTPNFSPAGAASLSTIFRFNINGAQYGPADKYAYYQKGCIIRSPTLGSGKTNALSIYSNSNLSGLTGEMFVNPVSTGVPIAPVGDNNIESFLLKKGFMVTLAQNADGTGKSKVYIASEEDLVINTLPTALQNTISFIRVLPWNYVTKKGIAHTINTYPNLNASWRYDWNDNSLSDANIEFVPMSWGSSGTLPASITTRIESGYVTHQMGFNEPDNTEQSGGYGGFTDYNVTVPLYKELMKIGCRLVSPGCLESGVFGYLKSFNDLAKSSNVRIDAVAIHWSDWEGYSAGETGVTGQKIFDRFKIHLKKVYDMHGLPIWITEFNANPNRSPALQAEFMALALPYLESCEYVERYSWFQSANGNSELYVNQIEGNGITPLGIIYRDHVSTPSIPESVVNERNNLNLKQ